MKTKKPITLILSDRVYIPKKAIKNTDLLDKYYKRIIYDNTTCQRCPYLIDRHCDFCQNCQAYKGTFFSYKIEWIGEKDYYSLPRAELYNLKKIGIKEYRIKNLMVEGKPLPSKLKLTKNLYDYQDKCKRELIQGDGRDNYFPHGIVKAPPRSGKCVAGDTFIYTDFGIFQIKDLFNPRLKQGVNFCEINLLTKDGVRLATSSYKKEVNETIKITTKSGFVLQGTPNHPVLTKNGWKNLEDLTDMDAIMLQTTSLWSSKNYIVKGKKYEINEDIATIFAQIIAFEFNKTCKENIKKYLYNKHSLVLDPDTDYNEIVAFLEDYGLDTVFSIPNSVLMSTKEVNIAFIKSLLGCLQNTAKDGKIYLGNLEKLTIQIQIVFLNLGILVERGYDERGFWIKVCEIGLNPPTDYNLEIYDSVTDIERINRKTFVYDFTVPEFHNFITNGLVSHNTLTALAIAIDLGGKFLIVANQDDLLKQFIIELKNSTNIDKLNIKYGICSKVSDFEDFDICLTNYQTFLSTEGKKKLDKIRNLFSTVIVDECFTYGHQVMTENGLVKIGDIVENIVQAKKIASFNEKDKKLEYRNLESVTKKETNILVEVVIDNQKFVCTPNHEFYVRNKGYIQAQHLEFNDVVLLTEGD